MFGGVAVAVEETQGTEGTEAAKASGCSASSPADGSSNWARGSSSSSSSSRGGRWVAVDSCTLEPALYAVGAAEVAARGLAMGYGVHAGGVNDEWDGARDSLVQYVLGMRGGERRQRAAGAGELVGGGRRRLALARLAVVAVWAAAAAAAAAARAGTRRSQALWLRPQAPLDADFGPVADLQKFAGRRVRGSSSCAPAAGWVPGRLRC
ncbi:hypothetical protein HYH02_009419 [Chlamydomonas schloesseri]|uniref:Uncharacterized protein n=1 Tax=Chlamydomonas schloesseri TaxID=2026947 RepID=A0A835TD98_9CHLO|nr:hypothetical protein HYH02_009419 [Chlamydomonas schloesseri]|eukprot:KAG2443003.1 hypothetical protein HYH02_009419 [Chlamydomonas schloesseri]